MERDIIDIVKDKDFDQLTAEERAELNDFCTSEEEFAQLKSVFAAVDGMSAEELVPRAETKEKLDALFHETYPGAAPVWYNSVLAVAIPREKPIHRQPLLQIAALVAVIFLTIPLINSDSASDKELLAEATIPEQDANADVSSAGVEENAVLPEEERASYDVSSEDIATSPNASGATLSASSELTVSRSIVSTVDVGFFSSPSPAGAGTHPDGIFSGESVTLSVAASETPDVLDLLTTTF